MITLAIVIASLAMPASLECGPCEPANGPAYYTAERSASCALDGPEYYAVELVATRNLPGLAWAGGTGELSYARSPFGIAVTPSGQYVYDVVIQAHGLPSRDDGRYVAWVTTPDLDRIVRLGALDDELRAKGRVTFNKFLLVVTFEPTGADDATWQGLVVLRGMSRSGLMHTMAGHGPFSSEPCAKFGY